MWKNRPDVYQVFGVKAHLLSFPGPGLSTGPFEFIMANEHLDIATWCAKCGKQLSPIEDRTAIRPSATEGRVWCGGLDPLSGRDLPPVYGINGGFVRVICDRCYATLEAITVPLIHFPYWDITAHEMAEMKKNGHEAHGSS
jgi:hypothetical protein